GRRRPVREKQASPERFARVRLSLRPVLPPQAAVAPALALRHELQVWGQTRQSSPVPARARASGRPARRAQAPAPARARRGGAPSPWLGGSSRSTGSTFRIRACRILRDSTRVGIIFCAPSATLWSSG